MLATLGRRDELVASGTLDGLVRSLARFSEHLAVVERVRSAGLQAHTARAWGPALVFGRLWEQQGVPAILGRLAADRHFAFDVERTTFALALRRLRAPGSDLQGRSGRGVPGLRADRPDGAVGSEICNGAADNASGGAATLAIAKAIKKIGPQRRSVVLAFWDAEEDQLNGSAYYAANPLVPNAAVKGDINFDIQGANLLPSLKAVSFAVGAETGGPAFETIVDQAVQAEGVGNRGRER